MLVEEYGKSGYEASMSFYREILGKTVVDGITRCAEALK